MLLREGKSLLTNTCCLEDFAVLVKTVKSLLNRTKVVLVDGWTADQLAEVEKSGNCLYHVVWYMPFDSWQIYL